MLVLNFSDTLRSADFNVQSFSFNDFSKKLESR